MIAYLGLRLLFPPLPMAEHQLVGCGVLLAPLLANLLFALPPRRNLFRPLRIAALVVRLDDPRVQRGAQAIDSVVAVMSIEAISRSSTLPGWNRSGSGYDFGQRMISGMWSPLS